MNESWLSKSWSFIVDHWRIFTGFVILALGSLALYEREKAIKENATGAVKTAEDIVKAERIAAETIVQGTKEATEELITDTKEVEKKKDEAVASATVNAKRKKKELLKQEEASPGSVGKIIAEELGATYVDSEDKSN